MLIGICNELNCLKQHLFANNIHYDNSCSQKAIYLQQKIVFTMD